MSPVSFAAKGWNFSRLWEGHASTRFSPRRRAGLLLIRGRGVFPRGAALGLFCSIPAERGGPIRLHMARAHAIRVGGPCRPPPRPKNRPPRQEGRPRRRPAPVQTPAPRSFQPPGPTFSHVFSKIGRRPPKTAPAGHPPTGNENLRAKSAASFLFAKDWRTISAQSRRWAALNSWGRRPQCSMVVTQCAGGSKMQGLWAGHPRRQGSEDATKAIAKKRAGLSFARCDR